MPYPSMYEMGRGGGGSGIGAGLSEGLMNGIRAAQDWQQQQQAKQAQAYGEDPNNPRNQLLAAQAKAELAGIQPQAQTPATPEMSMADLLRIGGVKVDPSMEAGLAGVPADSKSGLDFISKMIGGQRALAAKNNAAARPGGQQQRGLAYMLREAVSPQERTRIDTLPSAISIRNQLADTWGQFQTATKDMPLSERQALATAANSGTLGPWAEKIGGQAGQLARQYASLQRQFAGESRKLTTGSGSSIPEADMAAVIKAYTPNLNDTPENAAGIFNSFNDTLLRPTLQGVMQNLKAFQKPTGEWLDPTLGTVYNNYDSYLKQLPQKIAPTPGGGFEQLPAGNFSIPMLGGGGDLGVNPLLGNAADQRSAPAQTGFAGSAAGAPPAASSGAVADAAPGAGAGDGSLPGTLSWGLPGGTDPRLAALTSQFQAWKASQAKAPNAP